MTKPAVFAAAAALTLATAACAASAAPTAMTASTTATSPSPSASGGGVVGPACAALPPASLAAIASQPVVTAAAANPDLSTVAGAVQSAGLTEQLNQATNITVFAPVNSAFAKLPASQLNAVLADPAQLKSLLTYHVVPQRLGPDQLAGSHATLQGGTLTVTGSGSTFTVNGTANVLCGNIQTANATVYLIDGVLMPQ